MVNLYLDNFLFFLVKGYLTFLNRLFSVCFIILFRIYFIIRALAYLSLVFVSFRSVDISLGVTWVPIINLHTD